MKKIYFNDLIYILISFTFQSLLTSDLGRVPAPFIIPIAHKSLDYHHMKLPLCPDYEDVSDETALSIISKKVTAYMQCPYIVQYDKKDQIKIITQHDFVQIKIKELSQKKYKHNQELDKFNKNNAMPLSHLQLHQWMLIKRLHTLQQYKETAHEKFTQKQI